MTAKFGPPGIEPDGPTPTPNPSLEGEGKRFGENATRLCGLAARVLGWRPAEFWAATPAELAAIFSENFEPVAGEELAALMRRFPDGVNHG
jgi:hypothetical protein